MKRILGASKAVREGQQSHTWHQARQRRVELGGSCTQTELHPVLTRTSRQAWTSVRASRTRAGLGIVCRDASGGRAPRLQWWERTRRRTTRWRGSRACSRALRPVAHPPRSRREQRRRHPEAGYGQGVTRLTGDAGMRFASNRASHDATDPARAASRTSTDTHRASARRSASPAPRSRCSAAERAYRGTTPIIRRHSPRPNE